MTPSPFWNRLIIRVGYDLVNATKPPLDKECVISSPSEKELDKLEELLGYSLPKVLRQWLQVRPKKHEIEINGQEKILVCGFATIYNRYNRFQRNERKAKQYLSVSHLVFFGHFKDAQDLGYFYIDPNDPDLQVRQFSDYGEAVGEDLGPLASFA